MVGMKMREFYSFTKEDLQDFVSVLKKEEETVKEDIPDGKKPQLLFLLSLAIDMLIDGKRIRKLKNRFEAQQVDKRKVIHGFSKIVKEWLEENNGDGNFLEVIKVLKSHGHSNLAILADRFLLRYSLPSSENGKSNKNVYSSSRDFLLVKENKEVSRGSVPLWNANPVEQALQNSVILEEVFRKLNPKDQKMFRLVTPTWTNETFSYWRRSSVLQLHVHGSPDDAKINGISLTSFLKLLDLEGSARQRKAKNAEISHQLLEHPFHRYQLSYDVYNGRCREEVFSCGKKEVKFWQMCGRNIEDLEIKNAFFGRTAESSVEKICEKIFLDTCPKLKKFKISPTCNSSETPSVNDPQSSLLNKESASKKNADEKKNGKVASNLHTLAVECCIREASLQRILFLCPNLKALTIGNLFWETYTTLLQPTVNGECLKLEKLMINYGGYIALDKFLPLRNYSEMLMNNGLNCLQHLAVEGFKLSDARRPPFSLYAALARTSQSLKSLDLTMTLTASEDLTGDRKWFAELSPFAFPNLTALKLCFKLEAQRVINFDFGTLKGMPKLERFEFRVETLEYEKWFLRRPGTLDWVFDGNRNAYLPEQVTVNYCYSEDEPILCSNLKQFTFIEWSLKEEDIKLLSVCFPNLTHLKASLKLEHLSLLLESFPRLEKLDLETKRRVSLAELRGFKEKKKGLRICQTISGKCPQSVEMKEHNGRFYFANRNAE